MTRLFLTLRLLPLCLLPLCLTLASAGPAAAANLKLLTTSAFRPAAQDLVAEFARQSGNTVAIVNDSVGGIIQRLNNREQYDVVVLIQDVMDQAADAGVTTTWGTSASHKIAATMLPR